MLTDARSKVRSDVVKNGWPEKSEDRGVSGDSWVDIDCELEEVVY